MTGFFPQRCKFAPRAPAGRAVARNARCGRFLMVAVTALWVWAGGTGLAQTPLTTEIVSATGEVRGEAKVFPNYVEVVDSLGTPKGAVGVVMVQGRLRLFLIHADARRTLVGWAEQQRVFNDRDELVGYYFWTPTWSYVYDTEMNKVGEAQCLAYQGVCAAGIAGYLLGLMP